MFLPTQIGHSSKFFIADDACCL